jgi:cytochrome c-type biogenesis protein CcmF
LTFGPLMLALLFAMPFGPLLAWKRGDLYGAAQRLMIAFAAGLVAAGVTLVIKGVHSVVAPFAVGLAFYIMLGSAVDIAERTALFRVPLATSGRRAIGLPRSAWGTAVAHFGLALTLLGVIAAGTWGTERIVAVKPAETVSLSGYDLHFKGLTERPGPNYSSVVGTFTVTQNGNVIGIMEPNKRSFAARGMSTNEAALMSRGFGQLYLSLGDSEPNGAVAVRLYYKPLVLLIWLGAVVMMLGGALSLSDRRLRVGAPKPARAVAAKPAMQAAE